MGGSNIFAIKLTPGVLSSVQAAGNSFVVLSAPRSLKIRPTQGGASQSFVSYPRGSGLTVPMSEKWSTLSVQIDAGVYTGETLTHVKLYAPVQIILFVGFETLENFRTFSAGQHTPANVGELKIPPFTPTFSAPLIDTSGLTGLYSIGGTVVTLLRMKRISLQVQNPTAGDLTLTAPWSTAAEPLDVIASGSQRTYLGLSGDIQFSQATHITNFMFPILEIYDCIELPTTGQPGG